MTTQGQADRNAFLAVVNEVMDYYGFKNKLSPGAIFGLKKAGFTTPEYFAGALILLIEAHTSLVKPYVYLKRMATSPVPHLKKRAEQRYWEWTKRH